MKVKINKTKVTTAQLFNDGSSNIDTLELVGKLSQEAAKKQIAEMQIANLVNFSVLKTEKEVVSFEVEEEALYKFCMENQKEVQEDESN